MWLELAFLTPSQLKKQTKQNKKILLEGADAYLKDNMEIKWIQLTTLEHIILRIILILKLLFYTVFHTAWELFDSC